MPRPPPKLHRRPEPSRAPESPKPGGELDEVERAISLLGGRHPEHERSQRELRAASEKRRVALSRELAERDGQRQARTKRMAAGVAVFLVVAFVVWRYVERTRSLHDALERTETRWTTLGFTPLASNALSGSRTLEADLPGASCFVALTSRDEPLRLRGGSATAAIEGAKSVAWCMCAPAHAAIEVDAPGPVGLAILRVDARELGGRLARAWTPFVPGAWGEGGEQCEDAALDGWVADHRSPQASVDTSWMETSPARPPLRRAGFRVVSGVETARPFGVVDAKGGDCMIAIARDDVPLSLRAPGARWWIDHARRTIAWCTSSDTTTTVWREGTSPVVVVAAPASRIGGLLGLRECAEAGGLHLDAGATWLDPGDLAWDAASLLRASTSLAAAPDPLPPEPGPLDGRIIALTLSPGAKAVSDPPTVVVACDPPLGESAGLHGSICAPRAPVSWWHRGDPAIGAARAALPAWLAPFEAHREVDAVARIPELLSLSRRLGRERFEPTLLEGVTELADGVRVIGRAGEDAIVAVGLTSAPPWVLPYFAPGAGVAPWDLGDEPRVVPLAPGQTVKLIATTSQTTPLEKRRTVVFRRAVQLDAPQ